MKCIDCEHCDPNKLKCYPKSMDCKKEYDLTADDLYIEKDCEFSAKKGNAKYYYVIGKHGKLIETSSSIMDFGGDKKIFLENLVKDRKLSEEYLNTPIIDIYELRRDEYEILLESELDQSSRWG